MEKPIPLSQITRELEIIAPLAYQESYDNAGLITGHHEMEITGILICLDSTEAVIREAIARKCNLIIAHHPLIFSGLKKITGKNYVERTLLLAIRNDIAIYAIHTNLDNVASGVNAKIAERLGLKKLRILQPREGLLGKLVTYIPHEHANQLRNALSEAGAGKIGNYDACSFSVSGEGTFRGNEKSNPYVGEKGEIHTEHETRIEFIYERIHEPAILRALHKNHPYEEIAFDCYPLNNSFHQVGSGLIGELPEAISEHNFLTQAKTSMQTACIRHTQFLHKNVKHVAVAGGSGSFLLPAAIAAGADVLITADFKYHQFFDADSKIVIADVGHYESEQFTKELIYGFLIKKFPTFALHLSEINTNPLNYF